MNLHAAMPVFLLLTLLAIVPGCREPAEILADHMEAMVLLAEQNKDDCEALGESLTEYLDANQADIEEHAAMVGESTDAQARRIGLATQKLDEIVITCESDLGVQAFKSAFAETILKATGLH